MYILWKIIPATCSSLAGIGKPTLVISSEGPGSVAFMQMLRRVCQTCDVILYILEPLSL